MAKGIRNIQLSFGETGLTHFSGMLLFQRFCRKLGLRRLLQRHILWQRQARSYQPAEMILALIYTMVARIKRIYDTEILHYNGCFKSLLGLKDFPKPSTLREFLKSITPKELEGIIRIHDLLRKKISVFPHPHTSLIFDLDSTVLPVFGWKIEQAKVGYNPKKPGRPSYQPLICFEGHSRDTWCGILRPGDTHPASGAQQLWSICQKKIPKYLYRIRIRADSGFFDHKFIEPLDEERIGYIVVAKMSKPIQEKVQILRYHTFKKDGWQTAQFTYQPRNWKKPHRFIVVRRPKPKTKEENNQLALWEFKDYLYHTFVTNLVLKPEAVWHFYKARARCELDIRELKEGFPLGDIPTKSFLANQIHFHLILLSYDLSNWFKRLCLPKQWQSVTMKTLHKNLLAVPGRLVFSAGKNYLRLPQRYPHQKFFLHALKKIEESKFI
jgi:hypothetical protein